MKKFTLFATCTFVAALCWAPHQARGQSVPPSSQDSLFQPQWYFNFMSFEDSDWDESTSVGMSVMGLITRKQLY